MSPPPPGHPTPGGLAGLLSLLFNYLDKPWKIAVVVVLALLGGLGWAIYQHHDELVESWLTPDHVELKTAEIPDALEKLVSDSDVDLVQVWSVDLPSNTQRFVAARRRDGERPVIPSPRSLPIIVHVSDVRALVSILNGLPICIDIAMSGTPLARRLAERSIRRACAVPIPPSSEAFVGIIYVAWTAPPEAGVEELAVRSAREIARTLSTR